MVAARQGLQGWKDSQVDDSGDRRRRVLEARSRGGYREFSEPAALRVARQFSGQPCESAVVVDVIDPYRSFHDGGGGGGHSRARTPDGAEYAVAIRATAPRVPSSGGGGGGGARIGRHRSLSSWR